MENNIIHIRNLVKGQLIRTQHLALKLHKEQEEIEELLRLIDVQILKEEQNG